MKADAAENKEAEGEEKKEEEEEPVYEMQKVTHRATLTVQGDLVEPRPMTSEEKAAAKTL